MECGFPLQDHIVVELVSVAQGGKPGSGKFGKEVKVKSIYPQAKRVSDQQHER